MDFDSPPPNPLAQMRDWLKEAEETELINPNAMTLATVDPDGRPSARMVLLKGLDERGAVFFTNRTSRKGMALAAHPRATLLFHWDALARQLLIEGPVSEIGDDESDTYFASRPRGSRIGAWASEQSQPLASRQVLEDQVRAIEERFKDREIPRPPFWGGYRVALERIEFWQGHAFRLHDRIMYMPEENTEAGGIGGTGESGGWTTQRLNP